jgi:hypothetical protein
LCGCPVLTALLFVPARLADATRGHLLMQCRCAIVGNRGSLACQRCALGSLHRRRDRPLESLAGRPRATLRRFAVGGPSAPRG